MITTGIMEGLFLAFTAVSGSPSSSEESCTGSYAYHESLGIPLLMRKEMLLENGFVDLHVEQHRDAWRLYAYLNGDDSFIN